MAFSFPSIFASVVTLGTGITTNVMIFSAYQANGGITLDWNNIPEEFKEAGGYKGNDPVLKKKWEIYSKWGTSVVWYLYTANCPDPQKVSESNKPYCQLHRENYPDAPEVRSNITDIEALRDHHKKITSKKET
ncbi:hypothetical protein MHLP_04375 [Candidatus Mycoplasma haematolamae str. Purdue]|uniref:Uncharacterized protein n=1 Tax=Mycoplasma haematolamae (strain Purdue) TaxID=1212765 RepID=I7BAZ0_MYCHA|nr:hypothetical protein [Candidatus Mycoplasma haematolamae]AFO52455.1 hypothetical protein MHLP_04375 [Candidatus Mycoplasma haematolamae str. Purdue]